MAPSFRPAADWPSPFLFILIHLFFGGSFEIVKILEQISIHFFLPINVDGGNCLTS
jgi:hypothetical protein